MQGEIAQAQTKLTVSLEQQQEQQKQLHRLLLLQEHAVCVGDSKDLQDKNLLHLQEEEDTLHTMRDLAQATTRQHEYHRKVQVGTEAEDAVRECDNMRLELERARDATARLQDELARVENEREEAVAEARSRCARLEGLLMSLQQQVVRSLSLSLSFSLSLARARSLSLSHTHTHTCTYV